MTDSRSHAVRRVLDANLLKGDRKVEQALLLTLVDQLETELDAVRETVRAIATRERYAHEQVNKISARSVSRGGALRQIRRIVSDPAISFDRIEAVREILANEELEL